MSALRRPDGVQRERRRVSGNTYLLCSAFILSSHVPAMRIYRTLLVFGEAKWFKKCRI